MQACNAHGLYCVPLYDTLGAGAVEFIITHSEVSIVFVEEKKISEVQYELYLPCLDLLCIDFSSFLFFSSSFDY